MSAELSQAIGWILFYLGLVLFVGAETFPAFEDEPEEPPRRYGGVKPTTRDIKPITPATPPPPPFPRTLADEVNPPRIPTKRTR